MTALQYNLILHGRVYSTMTHSWWFRANLCLHSADDSVHLLTLLFILLSLHGK